MITQPPDQSRPATFRLKNITEATQNAFDWLEPALAAGRLLGRN
jgi:hypothetical protein